ncbi:hypothetical protein [Streptomyces sp. NPDC005953]
MSSFYTSRERRAARAPWNDLDKVIADADTAATRTTGADRPRPPDDRR